MRDDVDDVVGLLALRDRIEALCFVLGLSVDNVSLTDTHAQLTARGPAGAMDIEIRLQPEGKPL